LNDAAWIKVHQVYVILSRMLFGSSFSRNDPTIYWQRNRGPIGADPDVGQRKPEASE
jgi:hypothetical protein